MIAENRKREFSENQPQGLDESLNTGSREV
jgi:hypothetical protein